MNRVYARRIIRPNPILPKARGMGWMSFRNFFARIFSTDQMSVAPRIIKLPVLKVIISVFNKRKVPARMISPAGRTNGEIFSLRKITARIAM